MKVLLSDLASGHLRGIMKWFTEQHAAGCARCRPSLEILRALRSRLQALGSPNPQGEEMELTPERRAALEEGWDAADAAPGGCPS